MNIREAYNGWSESYDDVPNKTRDLEARALALFLENQFFNRVLEIGCGTGKNTKRLGAIGEHVTAVDFSEGMLAKAKQKLASGNITFVQADVNEQWKFVTAPFDLITCSLVLEHIEALDVFFHRAAASLNQNGLVYVCELHPIKQYQGSKARFETETGLRVLDCFTHHVSDYFNATFKNGLVCDALQEWFDDDDKTGIPRLISFVFRKTT